MTVSNTSSEWRSQVPVGLRSSPGSVTRRLAITSVFGDPLNPATWSGAPFNVAQALRAQGNEVLGIYAQPAFFRTPWDAWRYLFAAAGRLIDKETVMRAPFTRNKRALTVLQATRRLDVDRVLHTGTLDLPRHTNDNGVRHYLYCDHTWDLAMRHSHGSRRRPLPHLKRIEKLERAAYASTGHIFVFGRYVRDNLIEHYGIAPDRITVVGSGMGRIRPYEGPKDYAHGPLLFVAKHYFVEKGGQLALKAFRLARLRRPDLRMIMVGNERWKAMVHDEPGVHVLGHVSREALEELFRSAALLLQPMLNDPWGQVYLEALMSRTPVLGLDRNGLPEITENGRHGFLVPVPDPVMLAEAIVDAVAEPGRLADMGESGQRHVLDNYSWDRAAKVIDEIICNE